MRFKKRFERSDDQKGRRTCKFCVKCMHWHPINDFYSDFAKPDGLRAYCKACDLAKVKGYGRIPKCATCGQISVCASSK